MKRDSRLSSILHAILHIAEHREAMTSEALADCMHTNPVVVRRTMAGLREAGIVSATRGHGGGWSLARPLSEISLLDVHQALGSPDLFGFGGGAEAPVCLLERAVHTALQSERQDAETRLLARMREISLSHIAAGFAHDASEHEEG